MTDFSLPQLTPSSANLDADQFAINAQRQPYSTKTLATAMTLGCSVQAAKRYLQHYSRHTSHNHIDEYVEGHPTITYAVDCAQAEYVELLLENGARWDTKVFSEVPLLPFAIMRTKWTHANLLNTVKMLLAYGVNPRCVPRDMSFAFHGGSQMACAPEQIPQG